MAHQKEDAVRVLTREEVDQRYTWDLSDIFAGEQEYQSSIGKVEADVRTFVATYKEKLTEASVIVSALKDLERIQVLMMQLMSFASLPVNVDRTNASSQKRHIELQGKFSPLSGELSFFDSELLQAPEALLKEAMGLDRDYAYYLKDLLRYQPYTLDTVTEGALARLGQVMDVPYSVYLAAKLADLDFPTFQADGKEHVLTFVNFEGELEYAENSEIRRNAFRTFSDKLKEYQYTIGTAYASQVRMEKTMADLRGYDSVFDYLLMPQKVSRELYDRQLDVLMEELAPHMRKYAKLLQRVHKLDKMTYADLKLDLDTGFEPEISIDESKKYLYDALSILGEDYKGMLKDALDNRWIDFVQNRGKSTGAFCASPPEVHPYILISWTHMMREVFVLAHELGHAGNSYLTSKKQKPSNSRMSMYTVEAPSTMNEMLMANHLMKQSTELRMKRWVKASIISRTYYHNMVTHFLEGWFQREVYRLVDQGIAVQTQDFNRIFRETLQKFWGEDIELTEGAELTWMRQPHYYMGLYPYTYSAGLTIATQVSQRILKEGQRAVDDWRNCLSAGGTLPPVEFAKAAGVDITTDQPLRETVAYIGSIIDELVTLTDELEGE